MPERDSAYGRLADGQSVEMWSDPTAQGAPCFAGVIAQAGEPLADWSIAEEFLTPQVPAATGQGPMRVAGEEMVNEQLPPVPPRPLSLGRPGSTRRGATAAAVVAAFLAGGLLGVVSGRASVSGETGAATGTSTRPVSAAAAYCEDLKALTRDLSAAQGDAGKTGAPNAYAAAEVRDAGPIYDDAPSSSDPVAARRLALALTLDGQARQQPGIDAGLLARIADDATAAVKAAPGC